MQVTEAQVRAYEAYKANGYNINSTAAALGISKNNLKKTLFNGHISGLTIPTQFCQHLPAGMQLDKASIYVGKDGATSGWYKGSAFKPSIDDFAEFTKQRVPVSNLQISHIGECNEDLMLEWPVYDCHMGMLSYGLETGADYDHHIARHLQESAAKILYGTFGKVKQTNIILGGDNQTSDNRDGITERSKHSLDTDSRFHKIVWATYETATTCIDIAAQFSDKVHVVVLSGNHDYHSAIHLTVQLHAHYRNIENIHIDISPEKHRLYRWGSTVFMATHGDSPEKRVATYAMQQVIRRGFANVERIYVRMGHLHKRGQKTPDGLTEVDGVVVERFPTLAAQEAYSVEGAYTSLRSTAAVLWHAKWGKSGGREITVGEIVDRFPL